MSTRAYALAVMVVMIMAAAGAHAFDRSERASAVSAFAWSSAPDLERVRRYEPGGAESCRDRQRRAGDREALVRALITVESLATPRFDAIWKATLVRAALALGLPIPNLTYGSGRVRLSIARATLRAGAAQAAGTGADAIAVLSDADIAAQLLDDCGSRRIVAAIVADILGARVEGARKHLDLHAVRHVARIYNGQARAKTVEAAVAHETYNALVYALFQRYRFERLAH
jgi:hypothetical protein